MKNIQIFNAQIERVFFYIVLSGIFLFLSTSYFLPMCDLPQHAGQIQALKAIITGQTDAPWFDAVEINFLTPYWIGYLLGLVLSFFMPVNYAVNTEVGIAFLLFVLAFSHLRKRSNGDSLLDWFLIPAFFSLCFRLGFLTFLLAIPVGVLLLIQNLNWLDTQNRKYAIRTLLIGIVLYFSHMLIFLLFCGICGGITIVDNRHTIKNKLKLLWPFYALSLLIPFFLLTTGFFSDSALDHYIPSSSLQFSLPDLWPFLFSLLAGGYFLILNSKWINTQQRKYIVLILLTGVLMYFLHFFSFSFFFVLSIGIVLSEKTLSLKRKQKLLQPFSFLFMTILFVTLSIKILFPINFDKSLLTSSNDSILSLDRFTHLLVYALPNTNDRSFFTNQFLELFISFIFITLFITTLTKVCGFQFTKNPKKYIPFIAYLCAWFFLPASMGKTWLVYQRFSIFLLPFFILLFEKNGQEPKSNLSQLKILFSCIPIAISLFLVSIPIFETKKFNQQLMDFKALLIEIPDKKRALNIFYRKQQTAENKKIDIGSYLIHFPAWYQALNQGWVDYNFAWYPPQVIHYKKNHLPEITPLFEFTPRTFIQLKNCETYDLMIIHLATNEQLEYHDALMKQSTCRHQLKYQKGNWFVYSLE